MSLCYTKMAMDPDEIGDKEGVGGTGKKESGRTKGRCKKRAKRSLD